MQDMLGTLDPVRSPGDQSLLESLDTRLELVTDGPDDDPCRPYVGASYAPTPTSLSQPDAKHRFGDPADGSYIDIFNLLEAEAAGRSGAQALPRAKLPSPTTSAAQPPSHVQGVNGGQQSMHPDVRLGSAEWLLGVIGEAKGLAPGQLDCRIRNEPGARWARFSDHRRRASM